MKTTPQINRRRLLQAGVASQVALAASGLFGAGAVLAQDMGPPAPYQQIIIPLSDGTRLHARLWLPERPIAAKVPVVLEWIPYRQSDNFAVADSMLHGYFAQQGIAAVRVDIRGSGNSDGLLRDEYLKQEQDDALEVIAWLAAQDWCNGNVGMIGISWSGFAGLQIAARRPPALKAIVTCCSTDDRYTDDVHFMGGGLLTDGIQWGNGLFNILGSPPDPAHVGAEWKQIWMNRLNATKPVLIDWLSHMERDDFWKHGSVNEDYSAIECAVYAVSGWADGYSDPVLRLMQNLSAPRKALIGPWTHVYPTWGAPEPKIGFLQECMRWWRQWLLDEDTGIMDEPMLRLWMGSDLKPGSRDMRYEGGDWIGLPGWPAQSEIQTFHPDGWGLSRQPGGPAPSILVDTPQNLGAYAGEWTPLAGGNSGDYQADNRPDDGQSICFDTPVLDAPIDIVGFATLKLDLAFEGPKALVVVRLNEVQPDGTSARVAYAVRRLKRPDGVAAGQRFTAEIPLKGVAYRFKPGNRIRLAISTTYWPMVWAEPSKGAVTFWPDATTFNLPAMPGSVVTQLPEFGPAVHAAPVPSETVSPGRTTRVVSWDAMTGRAELAMTNGGGIRRIDGQTMGGNGRETFSVMPHDASTARYEGVRVTTRERPDWQVRTQSETRIYWEDGKLVMENRFLAYEDGEMIFSKDWKNAFTY